MFKIEFKVDENFVQNDIDMYLDFLLERSQYPVLIPGTYELIKEVFEQRSEFFVANDLFLKGLEKFVEIYQAAQRILGQSQ